ncbi:hypothetical protein [Levilactobacillus tujiorum]|uniref:hypothetical protein n=1 Tax=Levilactobacillus tujiorum TaxID=2912243 RepID=UPI0014567CA3|nr:hypothetical protein [Levilactobacillus tujiorum]
MFFGEPLSYFSVGLGGMSAAFISLLLNSEVKRLHKKVKKVIDMGSLTSPTLFQVLLFTLGLVLTFIFFATYFRRHKHEKMTNYLLMSGGIFAVFIIYLVLCIAQGKVSWLLELSLWAMVSLLIWLAVCLVRSIYKWVLINPEDQSKIKIDLAKMTLVWTVIIAVIGWIVKGK